MGRKRGWSTERKWEASIVEKRFEKLLAENGFTVVWIVEYVTKTDYLIEKDDVACEFSIHHTDSRAKKCFDNFVAAYNIKVEYEKLKAMVSEYEKK